MTKRLVTGAVAIGLAFGAAACSGDKKIDKEGSVEQLVDSGLSQEQAECMVDGLDAEFGDDQDALDVILSDDSEITDLSEEDQAKFNEITASCVGGATTATTAGG